MRKSPFRQDVDRVLEKAILKMESAPSWKVFTVMAVPATTLVIVADGIARGWQ